MVGGGGGGRGRVQLPPSLISSPSRQATECNVELQGIEPLYFDPDRCTGAWGAGKWMGVEERVWVKGDTAAGADAARRAS